MGQGESSYFKGVQSLTGRGPPWSMKMREAGLFQAHLSGNSGTRNSYISRAHTTGPNTSKNISCLSSYHQRLRLTNLHYCTCPLVIIILLKYLLPWDKVISDIIYNNAFFLLSTISPCSFSIRCFSFLYVTFQPLPHE